MLQKEESIGRREDRIVVVALAAKFDQVELSAAVRKTRQGLML